MVTFTYNSSDPKMHGHGTMRFRCEYCNTEHMYYMYAPAQCSNCAANFGETMGKLVISKQTRIDYHNSDPKKVIVALHRVTNVPVTRDCLL